MKIIVFVHPNAAKNEIRSFEEPNIYHVGLRAAPIEGEANIALIEFLSEHFHLAKSLIFIVRGGKNKQKIIEIPDNTNIK